MKLLTIGFTQKSAEKFFGLLEHSGAKRIVGVRLNNVSQLAGFAKKQDLEYFAREICRIDYVHVPELAPTQELLDQVKQPMGWCVSGRARPRPVMVPICRCKSRAADRRTCIRW
jgi:uncharacterized protein (DUF488 family)